MLEMIFLLVNFIGILALLYNPYMFIAGTGVNLSDSNADLSFTMFEILFFAVIRLFTAIKIDNKYGNFDLVFPRSYSFSNGLNGLLIQTFVSNGAILIRGHLYAHL
jgi:hypothetical protein